MAGNIPLDPGQWENPKQRGIGRITVCQYQTTDDSKTKDGMTFTEFYGYPRPATTWHIEIERLDAVYVNKVTGERSVAKRYQTLQLERYDTDKKTWRTATQGDNKNQFILNKFIEAGARMGNNPEVLEGMVIEYEIELTHKFGGNIAKNLLYPVRILAKPGQDYEFRGEVEEFEFDPDREDRTSLDQAAEDQAQTQQSGSSNGRNGSSNGAAKLSEADILALLVGLDPENEDAIGEMVAEHKGQLDSKTRNALISGVFVEEMTEANKLVVVDGAFALA